MKTAAPAPPTPPPMPSASVLLRQAHRRAGLSSALLLLDTLSHFFLHTAAALGRILRASIVGMGMHRHLTWVLDLNPDRALRNVPRVQTPPPGITSIHDGCPLCLHNVEWMSGGLQPAFPLELPSGLHAALTSPWPLGDIHHTIVSENHVKQDWRNPGSEADSVAGLVKRSLDLIHLARQLPDYIVFHNGFLAGASLPLHVHHQVLHRWPGMGEWSIQSALRELERTQGRRPIAILTPDHYPVAAIAFTGSAEEVQRNAACVLERWARESALPGGLTGNLIAFNSSDAHWAGRLTLILIPRCQPPDGDTGRLVRAIGSLELAGEIVLSSRDEMDDLCADGEGFDKIWMRLASTQDDAARESVLRLLPESLATAGLPAALVGAATHMTQELLVQAHRFVQAQDDADLERDKFMRLLEEFTPPQAPTSRRAAASTKGSPAPCAETRLKLDDKTVEMRKGEQLLNGLTPERSNVLRALASRRLRIPGSPADPLPPLTRAELVSEIRRFEPGFEEDSLNQRISKLRQLLAEQNFGSELISTVRRNGTVIYRLMIQRGHVTP